MIPKLSRTAVVPSLVKGCVVSISLIRGLRKIRKVLGIDLVYSTFIPTFLDSFEKTVTLIAKTGEDPELGLEETHRIFGKLIADADQKRDFVRIFCKKLEKQKRKILEHEQVLATREFETSELSDLASSVISGVGLLTAKPKKKTESGKEKPKEAKQEGAILVSGDGGIEQETGFLGLTSQLFELVTGKSSPQFALVGTVFDFIERLDLGKTDVDTSVLDTMSAGVTSANKTLLASVDVMATLAGISAGQLTHYFFGLTTPTRGWIASCLAKGFLGYSGLIHEIADARSLYSGLLAFSSYSPYGLTSPLVMGIVDSIYGKAVSVYPDLLPRLKPEVPVPADSSGILSVFKGGINSLAGYFKQAWTRVSETYDPYSKVFYELDYTKREKLIDKMAEDKEINSYRATVMRMISGKIYTSLPVALVLSATKSLSAFKDVYESIIRGGARLTAQYLIVGAESLVSYLGEQKVKADITPLSSP